MNISKNLTDAEIIEIIRAYAEQKKYIEALEEQIEKIIKLVKMQKEAENE